MSWLTRCFLAVSTAVIAGVLLPAVAWANEGSAAVLAGEAVRRGPRLGAFGLLGLLCCLGVVAIVAVVVMLIMRNSRRRQ